MSKRIPNDLSVGEVSKRAGVPVSTLHYYEEEGLIASWRTPANHRRYDRAELRRIAIIRVAQSVGVPLAEIKEALATVPRGKKISVAQWEAASAIWQTRLNDRIAQLVERFVYTEDVGSSSLSSPRPVTPEVAGSSPVNRATPPSTRHSLCKVLCNLSVIGFWLNTKLNPKRVTSVTVMTPGRR